MKLPGKTDGLNLANWAGDYYLTSTLKEEIVAAWNSSNPTKTATVDDVSFVKGTNPNTWKAHVLTDDFDRFDNISLWKDGVTSYYVNIKHQGGKFGVVRNHIYDYEFTNVIGLGVPGNEQENPKDPEASYLAAVVYCLKWNVVSNQTVLE